jgi:prepilin signal peptidase PulO-like enzyme (type II secretory pathway)
MLLFDRKQGNFMLFERIFCLCFAFMIFFAVFCIAKNGFGFGDVKFAAFLGYSLGFTGTVAMLYMVAIFCILVYSIGILCYHWNSTVKLPFAPFLGAASVLIIGFIQ